MTDMLEMLQWNVASMNDLEEFSQETLEAHQHAQETLYLDRIGRVMTRDEFLEQTRDEFLEQTALELRNGELLIAAEVDREQDGSPIRLECRLNLYP